jgi:hypothetical protein
MGAFSVESHSGVCGAMLSQAELDSVSQTEPQYGDVLVSRRRKPEGAGLLSWKMQVATFLAAVTSPSNDAILPEFEPNKQPQNSRTHSSCYFGNLLFGYSKSVSEHYG